MESIAKAGGRRNPARRRTPVPQQRTHANTPPWHGVFVWDQLGWREPIRQVADSWIALAAIAAATEQVMLGPMVTLFRAARQGRQGNREPGRTQWWPADPWRGSGRRPVRRGVLKDRGGVDERVRGPMLDEALEILVAAWSGEPAIAAGTTSR